MDSSASFSPSLMLPRPMCARPSLNSRMDLIAADVQFRHQRLRLPGVLERFGEVAGLQIGVAQIDQRLRQPLAASRTPRVRQRRQARAALLRAVAAGIGHVRDAALHLDERRFVAQHQREAAGGLELRRGPVQIAGVRVDANQRQHGLQRARVVVHLVRQIQGPFEVRQRRLRLPERAQDVPPKHRHPVAFGCRFDGLDVDVAEFGARRRILIALVQRIGPHEMFRHDGLPVPLASHRVQAGDRRVDVRVAVHVGVDHAPNLKHLNFGYARFSRRGHGVDEFRRALGIGPIEHFNPVGEGLPGGRMRYGGSRECHHPHQCAALDLPHTGSKVRLRCSTLKGRVLP